MAGKPGCGGKKGRSGRKGYNEEAAINDILRLSATTVMQYLKHEEYPLDKKAQIATEFVKRRVGNKQESKIELTQEEQKHILKTLDEYVLQIVPEESW